MFLPVLLTPHWGSREIGEGNWGGDEFLIAKIGEIGEF